MDPSSDGPYEVTTTDHVVQSDDGFDISLTVFTPMLEQRDAAGLPLVIALPGRGFTYTGYEHMTRHLATHGFIVVGANVASTDFNAPAEHDL